MITRPEFDVLCALYKRADLKAGELAQITGMTPEETSEVYGRIVEKQLVDDGGVTEQGLEELAPYKVDNAIIMAAGTSSRFAPVSYEKPKGLLKVRGQILIERQIEQLLEAGVDDITVVVGYKAELFFYLEEKYGVKLVVNPEFARRNNNSTLMRVREQLGNTFICTSDIYYMYNLFEPYVWKAYYGAEYSEGPTTEVVISIDDNGRITHAQRAGENTWYMADQAYFDRAFSAHFREILEAEYDDPDTADKLWEQIYAEHIDEFDMEIRKYETGTVFEFDSLDEMKDFDPLFLENLDVDIFDKIAAVLGCDKSEFHDVYPLKQGLTNLSCHIATNDGEYVYRYPGVGTEQMIDRAAELQALELAKEIGIDSTFIYEDPETGWKLSRFIPNCRELDPNNEDELAEAMALARKLHSQDVKLDRQFDYFSESMKYEELLLEKGPIEVKGYYELRDQAVRAKALADADGAPKCITHNDFFNLNLLYEEDGTLNLIDWEYAGMADYASDYGTFVVTCMLDEAAADHALACYFGRTPTLEERRHNYVFIGLAGWCWYVWSLQKESEGDFVGEWMYTYYRYAKKYLPKALALYE